MFRKKFDKSHTESAFDKSHAEPTGGKNLIKMCGGEAEASHYTPMTCLKTIKPLYIMENCNI